MPEIHVPKIKLATVRRDGLDVVILIDGKMAAELPWDAALLLADAIKEQARRIEEWVKAEQIAYDEAILLRKGIPLGLTSNPVIIKEAGKLAGWDSNLRRYLPGGVRSQEAVGAPSVIRHKPRRGNGQAT